MVLALDKRSFLRTTTLLVLVFTCSSVSAQSIDFALIGASARPGDSVQVGVVLGLDVAAESVQVAVTHDPAVVTPTSVTPGPAIPAMPFFFNADLDIVDADDGSIGVVVSVVFDMIPTAQSIGPAVGLDLLTIDYAVSPLADLGDSALVLEGGVFSNGVSYGNLVVSASGGMVAALPANSLTGASITVGPPPVSAPFSRGDCDPNGILALSDVIELLAILFSGGVATCAQACDVNASGTLSLSDAIDLLAVLFMGSVLPAPVPPDCGFDPPTVSLSCGDFPPCTP